MGFKSKLSTSNKTKHLTSGVFSDSTKQQKNLYFKEYSQLSRNDAKSSSSSPVTSSSNLTPFPPLSTTRSNHDLLIKVFWSVCCSAGVCLPLCLSVCLSVCPYVCPYVCMYVSRSLGLPLCLCLSVFLNI